MQATQNFLSVDPGVVCSLADGTRRRRRTESEQIVNNVVNPRTPDLGYDAAMRLTDGEIKDNP